MATKCSSSLKYSGTCFVRSLEIVGGTAVNDTLHHNGSVTKLSKEVDNLITCLNIIVKRQVALQSNGSV